MPAVDERTGGEWLATGLSRAYAHGARVRPGDGPVALAVAVGGYTRRTMHASRGESSSAEPRTCLLEQGPRAVSGLRRDGAAQRCKRPATVGVLLRYAEELPVLGRRAVTAGRLDPGRSPFVGSSRFGPAEPGLCRSLMRRRAAPAGCKRRTPSRGPVSKRGAKFHDLLGMPVLPLGKAAVLLGSLVHGLARNVRMTTQPMKQRPW